MKTKSTLFKNLRWFAVHERKRDLGRALKIWRSALDRRKPIDWKDASILQKCGRIVAIGVVLSPFFLLIYWVF